MMTRIKLLARLLLMMPVVLSLHGCVQWVKDTADLQRWVVQERARPPGKIEPLPEYKPYQSFVYRGASLREPFRPLVTAEGPELLTGGGDSEIKPDAERIKDYLESFAIDDMQMVGTIQLRGGDNLWALIRDPNGAIHRVAQGTRMGLDYGKVVQVTEIGVQLIEIVSNGRGGWMNRQRSIDLDRPSVQGGGAAGGPEAGPRRRPN